MALKSIALSRYLAVLRFLICLISVLVGPAEVMSAQNCSALTRLRLSQARVTLARAELSGSFTSADGSTEAGLPKFCRVVIRSEPSAHSNIQLEVWLPFHTWNRRFVGIGNGGFGGIIEYTKLAKALREGYVASTSDMGTSPASPTQADSLIGQQEKWKDFGYRSTHIMTVMAKRIALAFYGKAVKFSYFQGCSTGGQQGLSEAQRYPADYDGIVSGAPAYARTRLHAAILWNHRELSQAVSAGLTPAKLQLLSTAVLNACGKDAGLGGLSQVVNPENCLFDPAALLCASPGEEKCLTPREIELVRDVIAGPKNAKGLSIYPGLAWGSEVNWNLPMGHQADEVPFASIFRWIWGPSWHSTSFDFETDVAKLDERLGPWVNATDPNLFRFQQMGHKLLLYHGWADPLISPQGTIDYFQRVQVESNGENGEHHSADESVLLFMIPGMAHCGGGTGPADLDLLPTLRAWVEMGGVPEKVTALAIGHDSGALTFCPYPKQAVADRVAGGSVCSLNETSDGFTTRRSRD